YPRSWSPDGRYFAISRMLEGDPAKSTIWIFENFGEKKVRPLLANSHPPECCAVFSPDGKWIAYESNESGRTEVYIIPSPAADRKFPLSTGITTEPRWSESGRELFFRSGGDTIAVASLQYGKNGLQVVQTTPLFKSKSPFDVFPDGQRI